MAYEERFGVLVDTQIYKNIVTSSDLYVTTVVFTVNSTTMVPNYQIILFKIILLLYFI